jgi:hypothetical protein
MSFRDSLYEKLNKNLERLRKLDTKYRKQHTMQQQYYDELHTQTQNVTTINFSREETQISIPDWQSSFLEGSQIIFNDLITDIEDANMWKRKQWAHIHTQTPQDRSYKVKAYSRPNIR